MANVLKRTIKGGAYFLASNAVNKVFGFVFVLLCSRYLGPEEFGIFTLGLSVTGIAKNIGSFGLPTTIQRFLSGEGKGMEKLHGAIITLFFLSSLIFSVSLFLISSYVSTEIFNEPKLETVLKIFSVGLSINIGFAIYKGILQSQEKVQKILIGTSVQQVAKVLLIAVIIIWIQDAIAAVVAAEIAIFIALMYLYNCVKKLDLNINFPSKAEISKVLSYSLPLVFVGFSYFLSQQTDRIMLGWLSTSSDVGIYTVSSTLALIMTALHSSLVSIFMPLASAAYRNNDMEELNKAYLFISKWVGSLNGILSLVFTGAGLLILGVFGTEYSHEATYQILLILTVLYFIGTWVGPTGALLQMADGHKIEMYNTAVFLILNIGFNYFFISTYGLIGAAWGTLISGLVRNILQVIEIRYFYSLNVITFNHLILLVLVFTGMTFCYLFANHSLILSIITIFILLLFIVKNITIEEKELINKIIKKNV